ncbi:MAG: VTT domain-containing protein, partial [Proteocatella sp.]
MLEKNRHIKKLLFSDDGKSSLMILMITRMVPIFPYNLQNFAYGITNIGFWEYTIYTFIFMLPGVSFFTIGAAGLAAGEDKWKYFLVAGILAVIVTSAGILIRKKFLPGDDLATRLDTENSEL